MIDLATMAEHVALFDASKPRSGGGATPGSAPASPDSQRRTSRQAERRGEVLAAARCLFNEGGSKLVTLRRLVARSGVTAPTIYNLVGNRNAVLEQALLEHHESCIALAPTVAERLELNVVSGFAEALWLSTQAQPLYARRQILLVWGGAEGRRLGRVMSQRTADAISAWIGDLCGRSRLAKRIGHNSLAAAIEAQVRVALIDWAEGANGARTLRCNLAQASAICLLRFVDDETSGQSARWLEYLQSSRDE